MVRSNAVRQQKATDQVIAIKANDNTVLKSLYHENYFKIEQFVLKNNGSKEEAKDVFQEAFIAVWRSVQLDKFIPENESSLDGYLYRIARNKWMDHLRSVHNSKIITLEDYDGLHEVEELTEAENSLIADVKMHFKMLGSNCREILKRYYFFNESLRTIAAAMNWTEATARNNKYRCIQQLRSLMGKTKSS